MRTRDILAYKFLVDENPWPSRRLGTMTFSSRGDAVTVSVEQERSGAYGTPLEWSAAEGFPGADIGKLRDYDLGTHVLGTAGGWPQEWKFTMKTYDNAFNRIVYYPAMDAAADRGIKDYEILACSHPAGTWYSVASGTVPASFYNDPAGGYAINFPDVWDARHVVLRVKSIHGAADTFGAAELHFVLDGSQDIRENPAITVGTASPLTVACDAVSARIDVAATTPYEVVIDGGEGWLSYDAQSPAPGTLMFTLAPNGGGERTATVTLRSTRAGAGIIRSVTVVQEATDAELTLNSPVSGRFDLAATPAVGSGQRVDIELATNLSIDELSTANLPDWITPAGKTAVAGGVRVGLSVADNNRGSRDHTVVLSGRGKSVNVAVYQAAKPNLVPTLSLGSPVSGEVWFAARPNPDTFDVVLATNVGWRDIAVSSGAGWIGRVAGAQGDGTATFTFRVDPNTGAERNAEVTFTVDGLPAVTVTVGQGVLSLPGVKVGPTRTTYYNDALEQFPAPEVTDGDWSTCHTAPANDFYAYEFSFPDDTAIASLIYYPRDSETAHGAFRTVYIQAVCFGEEGIEPYPVEIPASVYATEAGRRAGWRIDLPRTAEKVGHIRIIATGGYQTLYSAAEVEFFAPQK